MREKAPKVCIVMLPRSSKVPYKFLSDLLKIFQPISSKVYVITGNINRIDIPNRERIIIKDVGFSLHSLVDISPLLLSKILTAFKILIFQIKISVEIFKLRKEVDIVIFYMTWPFYLIPLLLSKIINVKTLEIVTRSKLLSLSLLNKIYEVQDKIIFSLIDYISPESESIISSLNLNAYRNKIVPIGARFISTNSFKVEKNIDERENIVGYIGRVRKEKGVMNLVKAAPMITRVREDVEFLIGGEGDLFDELKRGQELKGYKIALPGWISQDDFSDYLNKLKILVLPTQHAEGLPTIILEAMACGTPVLATPVGAIPDVIKDGKTGFILENNSPECIAENIIKVLEHPDLDGIVKNARKMIEVEYTYKAAVERYNKMLKQVLN